MPDQEIVTNDPITSLLGPPGAYDSGTLQADENDDTPDDVMAALEENNLAGKNYKCILKHIPDGGSEADMTWVHDYVREYPSTDTIAKEYGPGKYYIVVMWRGTVEGGKRGQKSVRIPIIISEKFRPVYEENLLFRQIEMAKKKRDMIEQAKLKKSLDYALTGENTPTTEKEDIIEQSKKYITSLVEQSKALGLERSKGVEWDKILPVVTPIALGLLKILDDRSRQAREDNNKWLTLLMGTQQNSTTQLIEAMKSVQSPPWGLSNDKGHERYGNGCIRPQERHKGRARGFPCGQVVRTRGKSHTGDTGNGGHECGAASK